MTTKKDQKEKNNGCLKTADVFGPEESLLTYYEMIVESQEVRTRWNFLAAFSNWFLLAGFVVFPGTFTSTGRSKALSHYQASWVIQRAIRNVPL